MIAEKMKPYVKNNSAIRMMFEEGNRLRAIYGADKVYDFSLGNPSVPAPECVKEAIIDLVNEVEPTVLHGYMSNAGFEDVRQTIAESLNRRFGTKFAAKNLILIEGRAPQALEALPAPDAVFIGGTKGGMEGVLDAVLAKNPDARICISAIALETLSAAAAALTARGLAAEVVQLAVSRTKQAGRLHLLMANNPIFLITGIRK